MWDIKFKTENVKCNYDDNIVHFGVDIFIDPETDKETFKRFEDELRFDDYDG